MSQTNVLGSLAIGVGLGIATIFVANKLLPSGGWCQPQTVPVAPGSVPVGLMPQIPNGYVFSSSNPLCTQTAMGSPVAQWIPWIAAPLIGFAVTGNIWGLIGGGLVDAGVAVMLSGLS
jgi:hypothetical protein